MIFVEGHSRDNTWETIQRITSAHPHRRIKILQQTGQGKGDAVRAGFATASGDVLMILDADLTMPPEELPKFYDVIASGRAEFANGVRLVYPMDEKAMQFLNLCAPPEENRSHAFQAHQFRRHAENSGIVSVGKYDALGMTAQVPHQRGREGIAGFSDRRGGTH